MINSLRAALIALLTLALVPVSFAIDADEAMVQESAAVEPVSQNSAQAQQAMQSGEAEAPKEEVPLEEAAEGVDASVVSGEAAPAATQLPFDIKAAADIAVAAFGGEVLKAEQVEDEMGIHFHIRVVNDGRVRDVVIDAANGEIIKPIESAVAATANDAEGVDAVTGAAETLAASEPDSDSEPLADAPVSPAKQEAAKEAVE